MTRLTEEQITQKAREAVASRETSPGVIANVMKGHSLSDHVGAARAAIIATLTEYAPHLLPRDADEELAAQWAMQLLHRPITVSCEDIMLRLIKHMRESGK